MTMTTLNVQDLVPHRGTMSWLDRIVSVDADRVVAEADLKDTSFFMQGGRMPAWIGIEYMAQTIAAWAGQRARNEGRAIALGFLVGTRRYEVKRQALQAGDCLRIEASCELMAGNGLGMFACRLLVGDDVVATANLSVFEPPDGAAFLEESQKGEP